MYILILVVWASSEVSIAPLESRTYKTEAACKVAGEQWKSSFLMDRVMYSCIKEGGE